MKKLLLLVLCAALPVQARILDSHTDIRVAQDGGITVTERITLQVDGRQPHSVLLREVASPARVLEVTRNGRPEPWELEAALAGQRLRIGARGKALAHGRHLYQIAYGATGQVRFLDYHDELRWSVPAGDRVTAEVSLPASVPARDIRLSAAGGEYQSFLSDGRAAFRSAKEPLAITVGFPKGVVAAPAFDYRGLVFVLAGLLATVGVLWRIGRLKSLSARKSARTPAY